MSGLLIAARLSLAGLFLTAAILKAVDHNGFRASLAEFGLSARFRPAAAVAVPLLEAALALGLLAVPTARAAGWGALGLIVVFAGALFLNLVQGRRPECHCFGNMSARPIGARTLALNGVMASAAGLIAWWGGDDAGGSLLSWVGDLSTGERISALLGVATLLATSVVVWLLIQVLAQQGRILLRLDELDERPTAARQGQVRSTQPAAAGLPVGAVAPAVTLRNLADQSETFATLLEPGRPLALVFMDPDCSPCNRLLPDLGVWARSLADKLQVVVVSRGTVEANRSKAAAHGLDKILLQENYEVAAAFGVNATPAMVLVTANGKIGAPTAIGPDDVSGLMKYVAAHPPPSEPSESSGHSRASRVVRADIGGVLPNVTLACANGGVFALSGLLGTRTGLVFWSPQCGYCIAMLPQLRAWEARTPSGAPRVLVISRGSPTQNQALGLRSMVLLDDAFSLGDVVGATGTPSAVLVDAEGKIASGVAVGARGVFDLLGDRVALDPAVS